MPETEKRQVSIGLRADDIRVLDAIADAQQTSRSQVARMAVTTWLQEHAPQRIAGREMENRR